MTGIASRRQPAIDLREPDIGTGGLLVVSDAVEDRMNESRAWRQPETRPSGSVVRQHRGHDDGPVTALRLEVCHTHRHNHVRGHKGVKPAPLTGLPHG